MDDNGRTRGTVQWFSRVKGYGFVRPDGAEEDVFVHYSAIRGEGYRNLREGQRVEFAVEDTPKGPQAVELIELDVEEEERESSRNLREGQRVEFAVEDTPKGPQAVELIELDVEEEEESESSSSL